MAEIMKTELVFIPVPGMGHLVSTVELAKLLTDRNPHLSISFLIMKRPNFPKIDSYIESLTANTNQSLNFVVLPTDEFVTKLVPSPTFLFQLIEIYKKHVRDYVSGAVKSGSVKLAGFVIDFFCTTMIDVADEFGLPTYAYFTSGAAMLGFGFHFQSLRDDYNQDIAEYKGSDAELSVPSFVNPVPAKVLPSFFVDKESSPMFFHITKRMRGVKGVIVNTFLELEPHAMKSLERGNRENENIPPVYAVGPILNLKSEDEDKDKYETIMKWLDDQPDSSVVFLCFGSMGAFEADQVKEIAYALERGGQRFLWSLRRPQPEGKIGLPSEYESHEEVLPEGFLNRTAETGKVIGWAPQVAVLSHPAVGGFVTHCGWNSILESVWCGVPMATWPMFAEQQMNAFELVKELGLAVEIKMDYFKMFFKVVEMKSSNLVTADRIENAIARLMEPDSEIRTRVKVMKEKSRMAVVEGGSSYSFLGRLVDDVVQNAP